MARTVEGVTRRYVEVLADNYECEQEDAFHVDCGLTYDGAPVSSVTGMGHLEGCMVAVFADGAPQAQQAVIGGAVSLDPPASVVHVGLPYTATLSPMRIEAGAADGTSQGRIMEIGDIVLRLRETVGGKIGSSMDDLQPICDFLPTRAPAADTPDEWYTGDTLPIRYPGDASREAPILIVQDQPAPMTILAIFPSVVCND